MAADPGYDQQVKVNINSNEFCLQDIETVKFKVFFS